MFPQATVLLFYTGPGREREPILYSLPGPLTWGSSQQMAILIGYVIKASCANRFFRRAYQRTGSAYTAPL